MRILLILTCLFAATRLTSSSCHAQGKNRHVSVRSTYLSPPVEGYRHFTLVAELDDSAGQGSMEFDPNACTLNDFGDREVCTTVAKTERTVMLTRTRTSDPSGMKRQLWVMGGTPLRGILYLVVPEDPAGQYRLVYKSRSRERIVISLEPFVYGQGADAEAKEIGNVPAREEKCNDLARRVADVEANVEVRPGFVKDTFFLIIVGKKPHVNTWADIRPVHYPKPPEYWRIDVKECHTGDVLLPTVSAYRLEEEVTKVMGTKGIELFWANGEMQRIDKP